MTRRPPRRRTRKKPAKKPFEAFLDNLADSLLDLAGAAIFGGAGVLVGKALGAKPQRVELPPGLPPDVVDAWGRLTGADTQSPPRPPPPRRHKRAPDGVEEAEAAAPEPRSRPVQLVKGTDGIYRPE